MKPALREYAADLSSEIMWSIVDSYDRFESDGFIGDAPCRSYAERYCEMVGDSRHITLWMQLLAFECYRRLARSGGGK